MIGDLISSTNRTQPSVSFNAGLVMGVVKENWDKNEPGKVKVEYSVGEKGKMVTGWIPVMTPYAADKGGMYLFPEIGTEVIVGFLGGRTDCPVVIGSLWSSKMKRPDKAPAEKNINKVIRTAGGHEISMSDEEKKQKLTVTTPAGLTVILDDEKKSITLQDKDKKNTVFLDTGKGEIKIDAEKKLTLSIGGTAAITLESQKVTVKSGNVNMEGSTAVKIKGQSTAVNGSSVQVKADGSLTVESSGMTQVKGSMVKVN
jgi:uncharacterized protein involved in type VI secretion and phage assembly